MILRPERIPTGGSKMQVGTFFVPTRADWLAWLEGKKESLDRQRTADKRH